MTALLNNMKITTQNQSRYDILKKIYRRSKVELAMSDKGIIVLSNELEKLKDKTKEAELALHQEKAKAKQFSVEKTELTNLVEPLKNELADLKEEKSKLIKELDISCTSVESLRKESEKLDIAKKLA